MEMILAQYLLTVCQIYALLPSDGSFRRWNTSIRRQNSDSFEWKLGGSDSFEWEPTSPQWPPHTSELTSTKGICILARMIYSDYCQRKPETKQ